MHSTLKTKSTEKILVTFRTVFSEKMGAIVRKNYSSSTLLFHQWIGSITFIGGKTRDPTTFTLASILKLVPIRPRNCRFDSDEEGDLWDSVDGIDSRSLPPACSRGRFRSIVEHV